MNKRGGTLTNWVFTLIVIMTFIFVMQTAVLNPMNTLYNKSYSTGLNTSTLDELQDLKTSSTSELTGSEVQTTTDGVTFLSSGKMLLRTFNTMLGFLNGSFIHNLVVNVLDMPEIVANVLIIAIWISLIMIIIYIIMKVPA